MDSLLGSVTDAVCRPENEILSGSALLLEDLPRSLVFVINAGFFGIGGAGFRAKLEAVECIDARLGALDCGIGGCGEMSEVLWMVLDELISLKGIDTGRTPRSRVAGCVDLC